MSKKTRPSLARLRELERRQGIRRWNRYYQTAIRASKTEAPSSSWCTLVYAPRFGRMLHALSLPEANVFHVAVYHPLVVEALDQYVIPTTPAPHFLDESPFTDGRRNKPYRGSVAVAQELGFLNLHPVVRLQDELIPFPYIGDLLLFLNTYQGVKPINWSIKASAADFEQPFDNMHETLTSDRRLRHVRARHAIEEQVHKDVGVPTVHVAASDVPPVLARVGLFPVGWPRARPARRCSRDCRRLGLETSSQTRNEVGFKSSKSQSEWRTRHDLGSKFPTTHKQQRPSLQCRT